MTSSPPTKPPRGVKQGKETSGLLMSVIRTLSASETNEQREKERAKLEKEYKKSDARLDELVAENATEIMEVMEKFNTANTLLSGWGQNCDSAVARLTTCRNLLQLRRDDLRRLWTDARTHHYALQMLTDIERVVTSEREVRDALATGRVLQASTILHEALSVADSSLAHVTALNNTRQHLEHKKLELVDAIVKTISVVVYEGDPDPMARRPSARKRLALLLAELEKSEEVTDAFLQEITPEYEATLTEEDKTFETTIVISLEALGVLGQLKEATEKFKVQIQNSLLEVIEAISRRVMEEGDVDSELPEESEVERDEQLETSREASRPLVRLVARLTLEFEACALRNKRLLQLWRAALQKHKIPESCLHTEQHYWSAVQQVMQLLLTDYLEIESVTLAAQRSNFNATSESAQNLRLTDYFAKKRVQRRKPKLFSLSASTLPDTRVESKQRVSRHVCAPSPSHLLALLPPLHALAAKIESRVGSGNECSLRAFIADYVRCGEAARLANAAKQKIDEVVRENRMWTERVVGDKSHPQLVRCTVEWWKAVWECVCAGRVCGACGGGGGGGGVEAARAVLSPLAAAAAAAAHRHRSHMAPHLRATRWLADDDIVRFLKALPNWKVATSTEPVADEKQLAQELSQAFTREAEILGSSLGDGVLSGREIVKDVATLCEIAALCESMDWLSTKIKGIPSTLTTPSSGSSGMKLNDKFVNDINSAAVIFEEISHKCLLFLHLEIRIECFHHLGEDDGSENAEGKLAAALLAFHEQASVILSEKRLSYIMQGLGEMMSCAVVWRIQSGRGSGEGAAGVGGAPLPALRHCLAALRLPHAGLYHASNYLKLLDSTPEEIIATIKEKGPQFSELEYLNAFKVIGVKRSIGQSEMKSYLKQLSSALGHLGVTV